MSNIWHQTNDAVQEAVKAGIITPMDEGTVAMLLLMAERMDLPDFPVIDGKLDNVTQSIYLRAAEQLGLTPNGRKALGEKKDSGGGKLAQLRSIQGGGTAKTGTTRRRKAANGP